MNANQQKNTSIDEYIEGFPPDIQKLLKLVRETISKAAPEAIEKISWSMPAFYLKGNLVYFAAHKKHIGFYPGANGVENFKERLSMYKTSKGAIQFPFDKPIPIDLIGEIVKFRVEENLEALQKTIKT